MFKVNLKTKESKISKDKLPTAEEIMPNPGFKIKLKKATPVKTF